VFPLACPESSSYAKRRPRRGMKTGARSPARTFFGWKATGPGTGIIGNGFEAIGIVLRDPRPSGCQATGIAARTAGFGSMATGLIAMTATVTLIGMTIVIAMIIMPRRHRHPRCGAIKTGRLRHIAKRFPLLPVRIFSGCKAIGYGRIAGFGFMVTTSTGAMTGTGTKAVMSTTPKAGSGLRAAGGSRIRPIGPI
jgi:hypothetical protein